MKGQNSPSRFALLLAACLGASSIALAMAAPATVYSPASTSPATGYGNARKVFMLGNMPGSIVAVYTTGTNQLHWGYSSDSGATWTDAVITAGPAYTFTAVLDPATNNLHVLYSTGALGAASKIGYAIGVYSALPSDPSYSWTVNAAAIGTSNSNLYQFPSAVIATVGGVTCLHAVYGVKEDTGAAFSDVKWNYKVLSTSTAGWIFPDPGKTLTVWTLASTCQGACGPCPNTYDRNPGAIPSLVAAGNGSLYMTTWVGDKANANFYMRRIAASGTWWDAGASTPYAIFNAGAFTAPCLSLNVPAGAVHSAVVDPSGNQIAIVIPVGNAQSPLAYQLLMNNTTATAWNGPGAFPVVVGGLNVSSAGDGYPSITATPQGTYFIMMSDSGTRSKGNIVYYMYNGVLSARTTLWDDAADFGNTHPSAGLDASQDLMVAWTGGSGAGTEVRYYSLVINPLRGFVQAAPASICEHQTVTVSFTVSNTGTLPVLGPSAQLWPIQAGGDTTAWQVVSSPAMPAQIDPGDTAVLAWTVSATGLSPLVTGLGLASFTATVSGTYLGADVATIKNSNVVSVFGPPKMSAVVDISTTTLSTGQTFTVYLTVTDDGGSAINGVVPVLGWNQEAGGPTVLAPVSGPSPATANLVPGGSAAYSWVYQVVSAGTPSGDRISFSATAVGNDAGCGLLSTVSALSGRAAIEREAVLNGAVVSAMPSTICAGDMITVTQTVTNTGGAVAAGIVPSPALSVEGPGTVIPGGSPAPLAWLGPGMAHTFTWTYFGSGSGLVKFTATTTGTDSNSMAAISSGPAASSTVDIIGVGTISVNVSSPATVSVGQWFKVSMTASNPGSMPLTLFIPEIAIGPGSTLVTAEGLPPASGGTIPASGSVAVSWTYSADGAGPVSFTVTGTGTSCGGAIVSDHRTVTTLVQTPANITGSLAVGPGVICRGVPFTVNYTVINSGQAACTGLMVTAPMVTGTTSAMIVSSPVQSPPATLPGGAMKTYTWTCLATGAGTIRFTSTATGFDANSGMSAGKVVAVSPPALAWNGGMLAGAASVPAAVSEGRPFEVVMTLTNTGDMNVGGIIATSFARSDSIAAVPISGPVPAGPVNLVPGAAGTFTWFWAGLGEGDVILTLTASGNDGACGFPYVRFPVSVSIVGPRLTLEKSAPRESSSAEAVTFVLTVRNTGADTAYSVLLVDTLPSPLVFASASGTYTLQGAVVSWDAGQIPPGGARTFRVAARVLDRETDLTVSNTASVSYKNWKGDSKALVSGSAPVTLVPFLVKRVFPNPYRPARAVRGTLKFSGIPTGSAVRIYTTRGLLVWEGKAAGGRHTIEWDGKNLAGHKVVPGVYACVLEGTGGKTVVRVIVE